jgi:Transposase and inactivated derivatives
VGSARKKYTQEYKAEAVGLVISSGRSAAEIARDLGVNEGTLTNWVNMAKKRGDVKEKPLDIDERAELKELREENRRLKITRDQRLSSGSMRSPVSYGTSEPTTARSHAAAASQSRSINMPGAAASHCSTSTMPSR